MSRIRQLAGETAIYGISSMLGRVLNYLLVPMYTRIFTEAEYGIVSELYALAGLFAVVFIYRMETAYFRFGSEPADRERVFGTAQLSVVGTTLLLGAGVILAAGPVTAWLHYAPEQALYVKLFGAILCLDALAEIPLARWRLEGRALAFASVRLWGIAVNIGANLFFLVACPRLAAEGQAWVFRVWDPAFGIGYIFLSNLLASLLVFLVLLPGWFRVTWRFDIRLWRDMVAYSAPLVLASLAGIVNETIDRELLKLWLPGSIPERLAQVGIYSAAYKLAMFMSLFTQAFRYAAEPFFFAQARRADARSQYALVTRYFTLAGSLAFLVVTLYLDIFQHFIGPSFREGLAVVPILLVANLALGLYYNLSIWYKLTDKTRFGGWIAAAGALVTILLNAWWIPRSGYLGAAWTTLVCYTMMTAACWWWGRKYYPVPYDWKAMGWTVGGALALYGLSRVLAPLWPGALYKMLFHTGLLLGFVILTIRPILIRWRRSGGSAAE